MKSYFLRIWYVIDPIYYWCTRLRYVPADEDFDTVFRARLTRYKGKSVVLRDGTRINKNDLLVKIHLHNVRIMNELKQINSDVQRGVYAYRLIKRSLPGLAKYLITHHKQNEIKAVIGITTLYKGANRLGFDMIPIGNGYYRMMKKIFFLPINFLAYKPCYNQPVYLFMSKNKLIGKYKP